MTADIKHKLIKCLAIGGVADGKMFDGVRSDRKRMVLKQPLHLKPLASAMQITPEVAMAQDTYDLYVYTFDGKLTGLLVQEDITIGEAWWKMCVGYVKSTTDDIGSIKH